MQAREIEGHATALVGTLHNIFTKPGPQPFQRYNDKSNSATHSSANEIYFDKNNFTKF